jgi:hypothetical protein
MLFGAALLLVALAPAVAHACPLCGEALFDPAQGEASSRVAKGFILSIAALASMPFILAGTVATLIVRSARRARR